MSVRKHPWWFGPFDALVNGFIALCGVKRIVVPPGFVAIDPHVHSLFSKCSVSSIERILIRAAKMGLGAVGIMDHNDMRSAEHAAACAQDLKRRKLIPDDFVVIPGTEIYSGGGHIGALFVREPIPTKLGVPGTVQRIHDAGGLAIAPHPFLESGVGERLFDAPFDAVEIESGSVFQRATAERARDLLADDRLVNTAKLGSSDAHYTNAIGICYTLVEAGDLTPDSIRSAIVQGRCTAHSSDACRKITKLLGRILPA